MNSLPGNGVRIALYVVTSFANLLIRSVVGVSFVVIVYYMAEYYYVPVNIGWFITAWVMCSVLSIAAPPVSGGMLVVTGMLMFLFLFFLPIRQTPPNFL